MNIFLLGLIIFVVVFVLLTWFAKTTSKKITKGVRYLIFLLSILLAIILAIAGRFLLSLPLLLLGLSILKIKGLTAFQIIQLWRLIQYLRSTGRFSYGRSSAHNSSTSISLDEAYKILGIKKNCSKEEVIKATNNLQKKIHPDLNRGVNTERLSQLVNESKEIILKNDFN